MNLKIFAETFDEKAREQVQTLVSLDAFKDCKIRIMPDVHAGSGCVIGFTADLGEKVIPNIVGVDIGCGMLCVNLGNIDIDFDKLDETIRKYIPSGMNVHENAPNKEETQVLIERLYCKDSLKNTDWLVNSLGSLGGGNHFIEVDVDDFWNKYLVIHTGSRNLGKQVADIYQNIAIESLTHKEDFSTLSKNLIREYKTSGREKEISNALAELKKKYDAEKPKIPKELCYLQGKERNNYLHDMYICQDFAISNRKSIADTILQKMFGEDLYYFDYFESVHNYIEKETNIVRKGAISAYNNQKVIIPMNMRDGCIIGIGKGNADWNCSAPHGAGRIMSRMQARNNVSMDDYKESMQGIYTTSVDETTIDESPMVYKPMDEIVELIKDTVEIERIIKPVYNFKASE